MTTTPQEIPTYVDPFPGRKGEELVREKCWKCSGTGSVSWGEPATGALTLPNGKIRYIPQVCYSCNGVGSRSVKIKSLRAQARREAKARIAQIEQAAAWEAGREEREAAEAAEAKAEEERLAAIEAAKVDCPEGLQEITGKILTIKSQPGYRYNSIDLKMLVEDDRGFRVWGTFPTAFYSDKQDADKGDRVTFTATVTRSDRDREFGFFSRPKGAKVMAKATTTTDEEI